MIRPRCRPASPARDDIGVFCGAHKTIQPNAARTGRKNTRLFVAKTSPRTAFMAGKDTQRLDYPAKLES